MATKRGKSQARRNSGNNGGMPGWAWMVLGIMIAVGAITLGPKLLGRHGDDGFFRPRPDPNAQPAASRDDDNGVVAPDDDGAATAPSKAAKADGASDDADAKDQDYSFYTVLPGQEVAMSDAQLAAAAKAEQDAQARALRAQQAAAQAANPDAATVATTTQPQPLPETPPSTATTTNTAPKPPASAATTATTTTTATGAGANQTPYILQAGAFGGSGDAETVKAKIAMLGLNARVESAQIGGKTVYRVRMGPYATATELAAAKAKLANGGLPAMAIKAK